MKDFILGVVSIVVAIAVLAVVGEVMMRAWNFSKGHLSNESTWRATRLDNDSVIRLDDELGWVPVANYRSSRELVDSGGQSYSATIQTDELGFRMYGNPHETRKKKVLFLGDSFTHAIHVSNDKTYYALLKKSLDIEVFVLAVEGYGTLQEYLMLDKYVDEIGPDLVVIQLCSNDFINNHYELELISTENNNGLRRPYFKDHEISYRVPSHIPAIREFAAKYSHFLYLILSRIDRLNARSDSSVESGENILNSQKITTQGRTYRLVQESLEITEQLLGMIRKRIPAEAPILAFSTNPWGQSDAAFRRMSGNNDILYIDSPSKALRAAKLQGVTTTAADGAHWSNNGHRIVAGALKPYIEEYL